MKEGLRWRVPGEWAGRRLDRFLTDRLPDLPPRSVRYALETGRVTVGGTRGAKGRILAEGEEVAVRAVPEDRDWLPVPGDLPGARVLYGDDAVAVLEKPSGCHTVPLRPEERGTLAGYLLALYPFAAGLAGTGNLPLLTRLDFATSGAVLAALSAGAFAFLRAERERGAIVKTYVCVVSGRLEAAMTLSFRLMTAGGERVRSRAGEREPDPRRWTAVSPLLALGDRTVVRAVIAKGRRHQVRAHLAAAGFPIVGDALYAPKPDPGRDPGRLMLHAAAVSFAHPVTGKAMRPVSPPPPEFGLPEGVEALLQIL